SNLACNYRCLSGRECTLHRLCARIPKLRLLAATQGFGGSVVGSYSQQLGRLLQPLGAKLHTHLREILIAGNFIRSINPDPSVHFSRPTIIEDHISARRSVITTAAAGKLSVLLTRKKCRGHGYSLECRARNVVGAQGPAH